MQLMELSVILEQAGKKDQTSRIVRSLRKEQRIWAFMMDLPDSQSHKILSLINNDKLNPGTLGLFALNIELAFLGYPNNRLSVSQLEECMVYYETFLQQHNPPVSLEDAAKLAIALIEKRRIKNSWQEIVSEVIERMHLSEGREFNAIWGTALVIGINLVSDPDELLEDLLKLETTSLGVEAFINTLLSVPVSDDEMAEKLVELTKSQTPDVTERILNHLISINERGLAESTAALCLGRFVPEEGLAEEPRDLLDDPEKTLARSIFYKQIASVAQIAGELELAREMISKSMNTLETIAQGLKVQNLSLLEQSGRQSEFEDHKKTLSLDQVEDFSVLNEFASLGALKSDQNESGSSRQPIAVLQSTKKIHLAGNPELARMECERNFAAGNEKQLEQLVDFQPRFNPGWNPEQIVDSLVEMGANEQAARAAKILLAKNPASLRMNLSAAKAYLKSGKFAEALPLLELLTLTEANTTSVRRDLAECYRQVGNTAASYDVCKQLISVEEPEVQDLLSFAQVAIERGLPQEVFESTARVMEYEPENVGALTINGKAYAMLDSRELAAEYYSKAVEMGSENPSPWLGLSDLYLQEGDTRKAVENLRNGLASLPGSVEIKGRLAELLLETGSAAEALPLLNELVETTRDVQARIMQVEAMKILGLPEYKEVIDNLYEHHPENSEIAQMYAAELIREGRRFEAKQVMQEQLQDIHPDNHAALTYVDAVIGMDYRNSGESKKIASAESEKIQEMLNTSLREDTENTRALLLQAELYSSKEQHEKAFEMYSKLLERKNSLDKSFFERVQAGFAFTAAFLGKFELALASIKEAVDAQPQWVGLRKVLSRIYAMAGEINDAVEQALVVLESGSLIVENVIWFVDFLASLDKSAEAENKLREIAAEYPHEVRLQAKLAQLLSENGEEGQAKELAAGIAPKISTQWSEEELLAAAEMFSRMGEADSVLACLEKRTENNNSLAAHLDQAGHLYQLKRYAETLAELDKIETTDESQYLVNCLKADTLVKTGEHQAALELLQNESTGQKSSDALNLKFMPERWNTLACAANAALQLQAEIHFLCGRPVESREFASRLLELEPENPSALIIQFESDRALGGSSSVILDLNLSSDQISDQKMDHITALKIDKLIETDQVIEAQKLFEKFAESSNCSIKTVGIRLSILMGRIAEAETALDDLLKLRVDIDALESPEKIGTLRLLVKAAAGLQRWSEALSIASEAVTNYVWHADCAMQYLQVLTKAREFAENAKLLSVEAHDPSGFLQQVKYDEEMDWLAGLLTGKYENEVIRWVLRGKMANAPSADNIRAFAQVTPTPEDASAMVAALHHNGQDSTAIQVAKKFPSTTSVQFELAVLQSESEPDGAVETLDRLIASEPIFPMAYGLRSMLLEKSGKLDLAINDLEQAINDWPNELKWRMKAAELWQQYGNGKNAEIQLQAAHDANPEDADIAMKFGKSKMAEKQFDQAIEIMKPLVESNPNHYEAWEELSEAYSQNGEMEKALEAAKKASQINPFSTQPYLMSGKIHLQKGDLVSALEQAKEAVKQNKKSAEAILFLAKVLHLQGEKRQALAVLEMTAQCENATVQAMIDHVNLVKEINGAPSARELIASLSDRYPENVELMKMLASVQEENGDTREAEQTAKRALQVEPNEPELHLFLGKLNAESGQLDQAIHHLSQGITSKTDKMDGYLMLSKVYEQQREFTKALEALKQAMEIAPNDTRSYVAAANLYRNSKDYTAAEKVLQKAVEIDPKDVAIRRQLGALLALKLVHHSQEASSQS